MVAANTIQDKDSKDHLTRVNSLMGSLIMGSSIQVKITQVSREARKDNLIKDNLGSLVVRILGNLQETRDNPTPNKVNQVTNKATLRGNLTGTRDNPMGNKVDP